MSLVTDCYNDTLYVDLVLPFGYKIIHSNYKVTLPIFSCALDVSPKSPQGVRLFNIVLIPTRRVPLEAANRA